MANVLDRSLVALLAAATVLFAWTLGHSQALTPQQIAERAIPSVVRIQAAGGLGSGFVVAADGRIATNLHVIVGSKEAIIKLADGRELKQVEVVAVDEALDLAVIKIPVQNLVSLPLGDSAGVKVGQRVVAIGHPLGLSNTVSDGLVSAVRELAPGLSILQLSAPISPGSSGGPLLDERGQVIGISTLIVNQGQNLNFGMPVSALKPLLVARGGTPLASWKWKAPRGRVTRAVPNLPLGALDGCGAEARRSIDTRIKTAISVGAPAYNEGNIEGCYQTYATTAKAIDREVPGCLGPREALMAGVRKAEKLDSVDAQAWAMRDAFDGVLDLLDRGRETNASLPAPPSRQVPVHRLKLLDGCSGDGARRIQRAIGDAIDVGAPLYNQGHLEACFRIYEGAALEIDRRVPGCAGPKQALRAGLKESTRRDSWADKAWAMRDAFDGLLELFDRKSGGAR